MNIMRRFERRVPGLNPGEGASTDRPMAIGTVGRMPTVLPMVIATFKNSRRWQDARPISGRSRFKSLSVYQSPSSSKVERPSEAREVAGSMPALGTMRVELGRLSNRLLTGRPRVQFPPRAPALMVKRIIMEPCEGSVPSSNLGEGTKHAELGWESSRLLTGRPWVRPPPHAPRWRRFIEDHLPCKEKETVQIRPPAPNLLVSYLHAYMQVQYRYLKKMEARYVAQRTVQERPKLWIRV